MQIIPPNDESFVKVDFPFFNLLLFCSELLIHFENLEHALAVLWRLSWFASHLMRCRQCFSSDKEERFS